MSKPKFKIGEEVYIPKQKAYGIVKIFWVSQAKCNVYTVFINDNWKKYTLDLFEYELEKMGEKKMKYKVGQEVMYCGQVCKVVGINKDKLMGGIYCIEFSDGLRQWIADENKLSFLPEDNRLDDLEERCKKLTEIARKEREKKILYKAILDHAQYELHLIKINGLDES